MHDEGNFSKALSWGIGLSIPLWIAIIGWVKVLIG
jgi:hypothetical protein